MTRKAQASWSPSLRAEASIERMDKRPPGSAGGHAEKNKRYRFDQIDS